MTTATSHAAAHAARPLTGGTLLVAALAHRARQLPGGARHHHRQRLGADHRRLARRLLDARHLGHHLLCRGRSDHRAADRLARQALRRPAGVPHLLSRLRRRLAALRSFDTRCGMLLGGRVLLGLVGGPIMPLSQMLLAARLPEGEGDARHRALGDDDARRPGRRPDPRAASSATPSAGSGSSSSRCRWRPPAACCCIRLLRGQPDPTARAFIDKVGLALLVVWVGALQIMLDEGRNKDWFASPEIRVLGVIAAASASSPS